MADLRNPANALNLRSAQLLNLLGSFWTTAYKGVDLINTYTKAKNLAELQTYTDMMETVASVSRFKIPIFNKKNWKLLTIRQSQRLSSNLLRYGSESGALYGNNADGSIYQYGVPITPSFDYPALTNLVDVDVIVNRISNPSLILTKHTDFTLSDDKLILSFKQDPFLNDNVIKKPVLNSQGAVVDTEAALWLFNASFDFSRIYEQFGYVLNLHMQSSKGYKDLLNAVWNSVVQGPTFADLNMLMSLVTDNPVIIEQSEVVKTITKEYSRQLVITDKNVYSLSSSANITVSVNQDLAAGDRLTDAFTFFDVYQNIPSSTDMPGLVVDKQYLLGNYQSTITFPNKLVPLNVTYNTGNYTRVEFEIGGLDQDVKAFWDQTYAAGLSGDVPSLAKALDTRRPPLQNSDPTSTNLPILINPMDFLLKNVFRNNLILLLFKTQSFGDNCNITLNNNVTSKILPPQFSLIIFIKHELSDSIPMDGAGSATETGYIETLSNNFLAPNILVDRLIYNTLDNTPIGLLLSLTGQTTNIGTETLTVSTIPE